MKTGICLQIKKVLLICWAHRSAFGQQAGSCSIFALQALVLPHHTSSMARFGLRLRLNLEQASKLIPTIITYRRSTFKNPVAEGDPLGEPPACLPAGRDWFLGSGFKSTSAIGLSQDSFNFVKGRYTFKQFQIGILSHGNHSLLDR